MKRVTIAKVALTGVFHLPALFIEIDGDSRIGDYAIGVLEGLIQAHIEGLTPIGIVLDQMEEYPEEIEDLEERWVREAVALMRTEQFTQR